MGSSWGRPQPIVGSTVLIAARTEGRRCRGGVSAGDEGRRCSSSCVALSREKRKLGWVEGSREGKIPNLKRRHWPKGVESRFRMVRRNPKYGRSASLEGNRGRERRKQVPEPGKLGSWGGGTLVWEVHARLEAGFV